MAKAADQNGNGDFKDVEKGQYRVKLVKMEVVNVARRQRFRVRRF